MHSLFNPDSKFMRAMSRVGDFLMLNFYFLITSIPIFTIGAAATALYTVTFRFGTDREEGTTRSYFRAFRENFRQATVLWLILLAILASGAVNTAIFFLMPGWMHYLWILFAVVLVLGLFVFSYAFPLLSQFENRTSVTFKNALALSIGYLPRSILMAAINAFPFILMLTNFYMFLQCGFIWMALYFAIAAYLNTFILKKVFNPFFAREDEEETQEEIQ